MHDARKRFLDTFPRVSSRVVSCLLLTHPDLSEAALAQLELQSQGLPGNLPGVFSKPLGLRLDRGAHRGQPVAQPVGVLCDEARRGDQNGYMTPSSATHTHTATHTSL